MVFRPRDQGFLGAASGAVPDQVTGQSASADSTTQITVSWNAVTAIPGVTNYTIEWSANGSSGWAEIAESPTASTSIADASLSVYTPYYYRIKANNPMGSGDYSANASATTDGVVPSQITGLTATLNGANVDLAWNVGSGGTPDSYTYTVQRSTSSGSGFSDIVSGHGTNSYTNTSPTVNYTYYYQVKAVNDFGSGAYSSEASVFVPSPSYGLVMGGATTSANNDTIEYIAIHTSGNATAYGDLTHDQWYTAGGFATTSKGYCFGSYCYSCNPKNQLGIDVMTIASTGSATDWGDMSQGLTETQGASNNTYGIIFGGRSNPSNILVADVERISVGGTSGSGSEFGDMSGAWGRNGGNVRNGTIWVYGGGQRNATNYAGMDTNSFTSSSTASDFGDLLSSDWRSMGGLSNSTRGVFFGGQGGSPYYSDVIQYITIASAGDSTDYGDLASQGVRSPAGLASSTNGICVGGGNSTGDMQRWTIATGGSSTDWGDEVNKKEAGGAASHY